MFFASDNGLGASDKVMAALVACNGGARLAYGNDEGTKALEKRLSALFEHEVTAFLVSTGTAANGLALASLTPPYGIVMTHDESHVYEDECCGPEFFTGGAKLHGISGTGAKISGEALTRALSRLPKRVPHNAPAHALSITQSTELGQVYTPAEVAALSAIARTNGLALHMDGARFPNAVAHLGCTPAEITWKAGVDVLSFGTTKCGTLACEALVFFHSAGFDAAKAHDMVRRRMRAGHLVSKHRYMVAQMEAFLDAGHWLDLASHANAMATRLAEGLATVPGIAVPLKPQANGVFPLIPNAIIEALKAEGGVFYPWSDKSLPEGFANTPDRTCMRLVTSFATRPEEVDRFVAVARAAARPIAAE